MVTEAELASLYIVFTRSGSKYLFDNINMTWHRDNTNPGHEQILFHDQQNWGKLAAKVFPVVGQRLTFYETGDEWVTTTEVVRVETV